MSWISDFLNHRGFRTAGDKLQEKLERIKSAQHHVLGVDPGLEGAFVVLKGITILEALDMPKNSDGVLETVKIVDILGYLRSKYSPKIIAIEDVPPNIGFYSNASSQFKLGVAYGVVLAYSESIFSDSKRVKITPRKWQYALGIKDYKGSIDFVQRHFGGTDKCCGPRRGWLDGRCDAACIALVAALNELEMAKDAFVNY